MHSGYFNTHGMKELKVGESVVVRCVKQGKSACVTESGEICALYDLSECREIFECGEDTVFLVETNETK